MQARISFDQPKTSFSAQSRTSRMPAATATPVRPVLEAVEADPSDQWILTLKSAYDIGYYRTESDRERQTGFPWQNKTCSDCPFWLNAVCRVHGKPCPADAHTCSYFDPVNHHAGQTIINERMRDAWKKWWGARGA